MRDHNVADYLTLPDMDTTEVAVLDDGDRACLDELGRYLVSTGAWRRFAIWLLHKHFELDTREVLVESVSAAPRGTQSSPVGREFARDVNAISMRFDPDTRFGVGLVGMEFAGPGGFGCASPVNRGDEAVLSGVARRLRAHRKTERFGVRLIRNPLGLNATEVLIETCDIASRTLRCTVGERGATRAAEAVETTWQWKPGLHATGPAMQYCPMMCGYDGTGSHYPEGHIVMDN